MELPKHSADLKLLVGQLDPERFKAKFNSELECLATIAAVKWAEGFTCRHCGNENYCSGRTPFSRRCTKCKRDESATANTIFHHCRLDLTKAFEIAYMVCNSPQMPASEISQLLYTRHMTCLNFKKRILSCISGDGNILGKPAIRKDL